MAVIKVEALVLRSIRMGDTSRIVTVLSREKGKWSGVAKGVRNPKSRFGGALELLSQSALVVYFRPGRDLQLISDGLLEREFRKLLQDSDRYHFGCAVLEFLDRTLEEESTVVEVYDLALRVLDLMEDAPRGRLIYLLRAFQLRIAGWLGYAPRLDRCVQCGADELQSFGAAEGGAICARCAGPMPSVLPMSPETLGLLRSLARGSLPRDPSTPTVHECDAIAETFLTFHIDRYRGLRSLRILNEVGRLRQSFRTPGPSPDDGSQNGPE